jgi:hypothetical protein
MKNKLLTGLITGLLVAVSILSVGEVYLFAKGANGVLGYSNPSVWTSTTLASATVTNLVSTNATTTNLSVTQFQSNLIPAITNTFDIGSSAKSWKDIYASGTAYLVNTNGTNANFTGTVTSGPMLFVDNAGQQMAFDMGVTSAAPSETQESYEFDLDGNPFFKVYGRADGAGGLQTTSTAVRFYKNLEMWPTNAVDLGQSFASIKDIYASGTLYGVSETLSANLTVNGTSTLGQIYCPQDGGTCVVQDMEVTTASPVGTQSSLTLSVDGNAGLKLFSVSDGLGSIASGTIRALWPMAFPVMATTTVATSTSINVAALATMTGELMLKSASAGNTTPWTPFATTTENGLVLNVTCTDDTATVTFCDNGTCPNSKLQLAGATAFTCGVYDTISFKYNVWLDMWVELMRSNN